MIFLLTLNLYFSTEYSAEQATAERVRFTSLRNLAVASARRYSCGELTQLDEYLERARHTYDCLEGETNKVALLFLNNYFFYMVYKINEESNKLFCGECWEGDCLSER
jgi:hypothetical protein